MKRLSQVLEHLDQSFRFGRNHPPMQEPRVGAHNFRAFTSTGWNIVVSDSFIKSPQSFSSVKRCSASVRRTYSWRNMQLVKP